MEYYQFSGVIFFQQEEGSEPEEHYFCDNWTFKYDSWFKDMSTMPRSSD